MAEPNDYGTAIPITYGEALILTRLNRLEAKVDSLAQTLAKVEVENQAMAQELDTLKTQVQRTTDAEDAAVVLLQGLKAQLDAAIASGDPTQLQALSDNLGRHTDSLAAAVVQNTPANPTPPAP